MSKCLNTLDVKHTEYLKDFSKKWSKKEEYLRDIHKIEKAMSDILKGRQKESLTDEEFAKYMHLVDKCIKIKDDIKKVTVNINQYYVDTSDILFKYYEMVENGNGNANSEPVNMQNSIMKYFTNATKNNDNNILEESRGNLHESYMGIMDDNFLKPKNLVTSNECQFCGSHDIISMLQDGYNYCNDCRSIENIIVDHDKPSYKDPPKEITYFSYKRINHLNEWLNQIQGKETTEIPDEIYNKILVEIKKQRITNMANLNHDKIKSILKQLKVHKYYEHIPHIINRLNGLPMPNFSYELEEKLRAMFKQIQAPFLKHSPAKRKNFLSYSYVLHKFLQLLDKDEYLVYFPLLKSRDKLASQDKIWKLICSEVEWQFIPSL